MSAALSVAEYGPHVIIVECEMHIAGQIHKTNSSLNQPFSRRRRNVPRK